MSAKGTMERAKEMAHDLLSRISKNPQQRGTTIKEFYIEKVGAGDKEDADMALLLKALAEGNSDMQVPAWFAKAGYAAAAFTLLFLMLLVVMSMFGHQVPNESRFLVSLVFSLGAALAVAFLGGDMAATGKIPFFKDSPLTFSATGGVATLVVLLAVMHHFYG
jgi:hypothetical protein